MEEYRLQYILGIWTLKRKRILVSAEFPGNHVCDMNWRQVNGRGCYVLRWSTSIYFFTLRELRLGGVIFSGGDLTRELFSSSPVLESMQLRNCDLYSLKVLFYRASNSWIYTNAITINNLSNVYLSVWLSKRHI